MRIYDVYWAKKFNILKIACDCGCIVLHPVNRWQVKCRTCGRQENLRVLRDKYVKERMDEVGD